MTNQSTTLTLKRIVWSLCFYMIVPVCTPLINLFIQNQLIATTLTTSIVGLCLMIQNWDLLEIHALRFKEGFKESLFFTLIGIVVLFLLILLNQLYFHAYLPLLDVSAAMEFTWFIVPLLFVNTFIFAMNFVIVFKCVTDRLKLKHAELVVILLSGFLFSLIFTITYIPFDLIAWLKGYLLYFIITITISYLYNQTHSFLPGMISLSTVLLLFNVISFL